MREVDVRGLSCPEPVMIVSEEIKKGDEILVLTNEAHSMKNIVRFCKSNKRTAEVKEVGNEYEIRIK